MAAPNKNIGSSSFKDDEIATREEREQLAKSCEAFAEEYRKEERVRIKNNVAECRREFMAKFFSKKDIFGDDIFEESGIDGIRSGRWLGNESYADPVSYCKQKTALSKSGAKPSTSKGKQRKGKSG